MLVNVQWIILIPALVLFVRAGSRPGIAASIGGALVFAVAGVLLFVLSQWRAVRNMPPDPLVKAVNGGDVKPNTRELPEERFAWPSGHYLYSLNWAICHGTDGSGGTPIS